MAPHRKRAPRRGAAAMEFALWLAAFLVVLVCTIDLAHFLNVYIVVQRAARDGARYASTILEDPPETGDSIEAAARDHATLVLSSSGLTCTAGCSVTASWLDSGGRKWLDVDVIYPVRSLTGLFPGNITQVKSHFSMMSREQGG